MAGERGEDRAAVVDRWLALTREVLPGMAEAAGWPIRLDHCFMRVFLDHAVGGPWMRAVRAPAIRHMEVRLLRRAVALAEAVAAEPGRLAGLNAQSVAWRAAARRAEGGAQRRRAGD